MRLVQLLLLSCAACASTGCQLFQSVTVTNAVHPVTELSSERIESNADRRGGELTTSPAPYQPLVIYATSTGRILRLTVPALADRLGGRHHLLSSVYVWSDVLSPPRVCLAAQCVLWPSCWLQGSYSPIEGPSYPPRPNEPMQDLLIRRNEHPVATSTMCQLGTPLIASACPKPRLTADPKIQPQGEIICQTSPLSGA